ncbi:MAG: zf-HC2 domain-containing protein [Deltaproteobacteria bacterium]|nr:zf-HC2 domain-containing protein [Deltaproteobacteria bacterium]
MSAEPMPHEEAVGLLDALRDGELEGDEAARVEAHLETCERCRAVEAALGGGLRRVVNAGDAAKEPDLLPGVQRRLHLRSRGKFYARDDAQRGPSSWPLLIASVALLVALAAGYIALGQIGAATTAPSAAPSASAAQSSAPR